MEVVMSEEKKKIFRARKTMKISDRQQLETLHGALLTAGPGMSDASATPPLLNGTHKEDELRAGDKEQNSASDSNSGVASPSSPAPFLSLNLSPSPPSSHSPLAKDEIPTSPTSPLHSPNFEMKKMGDEEEIELKEKGKERKGSPVSSSKDSVTPASTDFKENQEKDSEVTPKMEKKKEDQKAKEDAGVELSKNSVKGSTPCLSVAAPASGCTEPMDTDSDTKKTKNPAASSAKIKEEKPFCPKSTTADASRPAASSKDIKQQKETGEVKKEEEGEKKGSTREEKMELDSTKKEKTEVRQTKKPSRPSSTPPANTAQEEKGSTSGLKRTLSEGFEKDGQTVKREGKRPKVDCQELEAQLEFKFTAKAGSHNKLEKIVQQLVDERLRVLELTIFKKKFQELKDRVDKIDCATKHQTAVTTLQAKINRLTKKFGEANQASENKRKADALAAATAAAATAATAAAATAAAAKTVPVANSPQVQRPVRTSMELKQIGGSVSSSSALANPAMLAPVSGLAHVASPNAMVSQASILQLISTTSNAGSNLATGITTQSPMGTLVLKTASGGNLMAGGQPLLIQLPLSMTNGQTGTLVNIPMSSLSAAGSLGKAKTTSTTTFILKPAPPITTSPALAPAVATVPTLQPSAAQMAPAQITLARAVYQGGAGGITTPNAGVSVTTARTPAQSVSVAGALSSASSPATSGPAATGSTAPGPPQGTSLTSKTDNQVTESTPSKAAAPAVRPKGSVIDLTEDDDDVLVTGVKSATVVAASPTQRLHPVISVPNSVAARSSPQSNQSASNPQLTIHHRPPQDSLIKPRPVTTSTPTRSSSVVLPPLPAAPVPSRLPPEGERSSPPQQPQLKLVPSQTGIVLSWCVAETDRTCAAVDSYHLYAFHQDNSSGSAAQQHWKKIGEVNALPLPMACTLTQFQSGSTYHFAVRAKDIYGRFGSFCEPQCTNVINSSTS
uniref:Activating transcription factor 7 interacting protein n=2 Tax=Gasterosteus aculeatus TaxID=69293 RepID=G3PU06_GASAC|nr:activating transcription factor 7-interacting protein 1 [Gasterosteus aculeatus aculeatus]XP_040041969.1 activating transcription factor 7-interacting protein 1 [Gasterosteus aculeatus aculeatus]